MDKMEFLVLIIYCFLRGKNTVEVKTWLDAELPDTAPGKSTIKDWVAQVHEGAGSILVLMADNLVKMNATWFDKFNMHGYGL
ncbi:hypothetical protein GWI33_013856 [Rhynchophorus ferrugineus]|uniref:Uncharacterized protein n=1 Tax=Rhynchophorus ferrugineus TaxID=354439 RepID=A0A834M9K7_RHYFE|nr:hypothetical protein GWI33_013856 [Rhynchophorus ferrugineus]